MINEFAGEENKIIEYQRKPFKRPLQLQIY